MPFVDRNDAGRSLAGALEAHRGAPDTLVVAVGQSGLPVAARVAARLGLPLEEYLFAHVRAYRGFALIGVVTEAGTIQIHRRFAGWSLPAGWLEKEVARARRQVD